MIIVTGVLQDAFLKPMHSVIRFIPITITPHGIRGVFAKHVTRKDGYYYFSVEQGYYEISVYQEREFKVAGRVLIDDNTPNPSTLLDLIKYGIKEEIPLFDPKEAQWDKLLDDFFIEENAILTDYEQLRKEDNFAMHGKELFETDTAQGVKHSLQVETDNKTKLLTQQLAYKDNFDRLAAITHISNETELGEATLNLQTYQESDTSTKSLIEQIIKDESASSTLSSTSTGYTHEISTLNQKKKVIDFLDIEEDNVYSRELLYENDLNELITTNHTSFSTSGSESETINIISLNQNRLGFPAKGEIALHIDEPNGSAFRVIADNLYWRARDGHELMHADTENRIIKFNAKVEFANSDDFIGAEGWSFAVDFEYSNDKDTWVKEYQEGHIWRKEQDVKFLASTPNERYPLGLPRIIRLNAQDGANGDNYYLEFQYTTEENYPNDWRSNYEDGDDWRRYRSVTRNDKGTHYSNWVNERIKGIDGFDAYIVDWQRLYGSDPLVPIYLNNTNNSDGSLAGINLEAWHFNFTPTDYYMYERRVWYYTKEKYDQAKLNENIIPDEYELWSGPHKIKPELGVDYENGKHGAGSYVIIHPYTEFEVDNFTHTQHETHCTNAKKKPPVEGDILTYFDYPTKATYSKSFMRDASSKWQPFLMQINGNVIVHGTLAAETLRAGSVLTEIIHVGTNSTSDKEVTISGNGMFDPSVNQNASSPNTPTVNDYRIWAGHEEALQAPFSIDRFGNLIANRLTAQNASVSGELHIKGNSTFEGDIYAMNGTVHTLDLRATNFMGGAVYADLLIYQKNQIACLGDNTNVKTYPNGDPNDPRDLVMCTPSISRKYTVSTESVGDEVYKVFMTDIFHAGDLYAGRRYERFCYRTLPRGAIKIHIDNNRDSSGWAGFRLALFSRANSTSPRYVSPKFHTSSGAHLSVGSVFSCGSLQFIVTGGHVPNHGGFDIWFENLKCSYGAGWTSTALDSLYLGVCNYNSWDRHLLLTATVSVNNEIDPR